MTNNDSIVAITEMNDQLVTVTANYKAKMMQAGFSNEIAERMTIDYHGALIKAILGKLADG